MSQKNLKQNSSWLAPFTITILSAFFYAFMEWLFFVTKPSSLSILTLFEKIQVLFVAGGVIAIAALIATLLLSIPARVTRNTTWQARLAKISYLPAVSTLSVTVLLLIDNFTYTLYEFGIVSTEGLLRIVYALGFLAIFWQTYRYVNTNVQTGRNTASNWTLSLLGLSTIMILAVAFSSRAAPDSILNPSGATQKRPNIIILGSDGLNANYMSMYGYYQETTPFLEELADSSLVAENAFPNASSTTASTTSALTGKHPMEVGIFSYPGVLSGTDSFEHLPGILKRNGYKTVEFGIPYYVDATKLNLLDGFDIVNNRTTETSSSTFIRKILGNSPSSYFLETTTERASDRLLHMFVLREMENPLNEIVLPDNRIPDAERVDQIIELFDQSEKPVFVFTHLMNTHGPIFSSEKQVFSDGSSGTEEEWDEERYKDALLSFDSHVQKIYDYLESSGKLDETILVVYTDHGYRYVVNQRIPILFHFPNDEYAGRRTNNVQVIDIPVTLLDYLNIPQPHWMTGISLLREEPPADREIISITAGSPKKIAPPFYQVKIVQVIVCQNWYAWNVQENEFKSNVVSRHTAHCDKDSLPDNEEVRKRILDYLQKHNYDISTLR